jgi:hypothetical protein
MVTCMVLPSGHRLIIDIRSGRWSTKEIRENLREIWTAYSPIIGVESNGGQAMVAELLSEALAIPLQEKNTGINKYHYAHGVESLAHELEQGFWIFPCPEHPTLDLDHGYIEPAPDRPGLEGKLATEPHPEVQELINEALIYDPNPGGRHSGDRLMAWWICAQTLRTSATGALLGQQMLAAGGDDFDWMAR